ncbi:MAG: hypothetical protein ACK4OO_02285, partial [bacterium]
RGDYLRNKEWYKERLKRPMRELCQRLKEKRVLAAFIDKSMFNSGEVDFLVIRDENNYHIFWSKEVVDILTKNYEVENSKAKTKYQIDDQKVIFRFLGRTHGEIEMRNDSDAHYRQVKFWLDKKLTLKLLITQINKPQYFKSRIILYGKAIKKLSKMGKKEGRVI